MSDYAQITDFSVKDGLTTGDSEKIILGADFDAEFSAISTAMATKFDSADVASQAQAEALALDTVLITPHNLNDVLQANGGMLGDIQALADPGADRFLGWDDSANAVIGFSLGTGLNFNGTSAELDFLGLEDLTDPGADRVAFWDESANAFAWLSLASDLEIVGTELSVASITESQISDLGTYLESGDSAAELTLTTLNIGSSASSLTQNATNTDQIDLEGDTVFSHESGTYNSAKIHFSNGVEPTTEGNDGDIFLVY